MKVSKSEKLNVNNKDLVRVLKSVAKSGVTDKGKRKPQKVVRLLQDVAGSKERYSQAMKDYVACVLRPDLYTAKIPSLFPVPSHLCQAKGTQYLTTNSAGCLALALAPHQTTGILTYNNTSSYAEASAWNAGGPTSIIPAIINSYHANFRVVGAWLKVEYLEPSNTRKGIIACGFLPYSPFAGGGLLPNGFTNDALRDQPGIETYNASTTPRAWGRYTPIDPTSLVFSSGSFAGSYPSVAWCLTGGVASSTVSVSYRVVYEIVPLPQYTDLLVPTLGPSGDPVEAVSKLATAPTAGSGTEPSTLGLKLGALARNTGKKIRDQAEDFVYGVVADKVADYTNWTPVPAKGSR